MVDEEEAGALKSVDTPVDDKLDADE